MYGAIGMGLGPASYGEQGPLFNSHFPLFQVLWTNKQ